MIELSRYELEALRKDRDFVLYRGGKNAQLPSILVLMPVSEFPAPESLERLEHEYSLRQELDPAWSRRPIRWNGFTAISQDSPSCPSQRCKDVPTPVSAIVMKLLAKTAEERYQTAAGAESDLRHCLAEWETQRHITEFPLGEHDTPDRLLIPEELDGRATGP
jgi:hypothetical protein